HHLRLTVSRHTTGRHFLKILRQEREPVRRMSEQVSLEQDLGDIGGFVGRQAGRGEQLTGEGKKCGGGVEHVGEIPNAKRTKHKKIPTEAKDGQPALALLGVCSYRCSNVRD